MVVFVPVIILAPEIVAGLLAAAEVTLVAIGAIAAGVLLAEKIDENTKDEPEVSPETQTCPECEAAKAEQSLQDRAQELKARNGGKNRVETPEKRIDLDGDGHYDTNTGQKIETPHVHDANPPHPEGSPGAGRHPGYKSTPRPATPKDLDDAARALKALGK
jgi:hypothetical protein